MAADYPKVAVPAHSGYVCCAAGFVPGLSVVPVGFADPEVSMVICRRGAGFAGSVARSAQADLDHWAAPFDPAMFARAACSARQPLLLALTL
jgi:hypothetical protein